MAMQFNGDFVVSRKRDEVYDFLTDPKRFSPLLPDYEGMTQEDETHFTVKVRVGISHIRGTAEVKVQLAEATRPTHAVYKGQGKVVGGSTTLTASFDLDEVPEGTKVMWRGEAQVFGPLASMAGGLLQPVAKKNLEKVIAGLHQALGTPSQPVPVQSAEGAQAPAQSPPTQQATNTGGPLGR